MNEFIEQFLLESRELVAQATDDLMALEDSPGDKECLDGAFRAFHTLKGAAGIVEFAAMRNSQTFDRIQGLGKCRRTGLQPVRVGISPCRRTGGNISLRGGLSSCQGLPECRRIGP